MDGSTSKTVPLDWISQPSWSPSAMNGPTLDMILSECLGWQVAQKGWSCSTALSVFMASGSDSALQLLTQCPTARRPWYYWVWQMRLSLIYRLLDGHALSVSGQYWGQKFLQGAHYKGRTSCGGDNSWSSSDDSSVMEHRPVKSPSSGSRARASSATHAVPLSRQ